METASGRFPSLPWPAGYKHPTASALQITFSSQANPDQVVIQLNKTAVVVAKPFRPEAESPLLQRNSFRPDVSKMFRNKTFFILFNCIYTNFRPFPPGPERLPARACPCLQGFLLSTFCVFSDYTIPITNSQAPTAPSPARQTACHPQAPTESPPRPPPKPSQFFQNSHFAAQCPKICQFRASYTI